MARRFSIDFDTKDAPGRIKAVWVELGVWFMRDRDVANVALRDHPLYAKLEAYVLANPSRRPSTSSSPAPRGPTDG